MLILRPKFITLIFTISLLVGCTSAPLPFSSLQDGACSPSQKSLVKTHITSQIDAISQRDWPLAYSFASKFFQDSVDIFSFEVIIAGSYPMLIDNQGLTFSECKIKNSSIFQTVIVKSNNQDSELLYKLSALDEKLGVDAANIMDQPDGVTT